MIQTMTNVPVYQRIYGLIAIAGVMQLAACASVPPEPTGAIQAAEQAIATADRARVADTSSPELSEARAKLKATQDAIKEKQMVTAERLANEARVDAELASARIEADKARAVNDEIVRSTATLSQEMQRNSGAK